MLSYSLVKSFVYLYDRRNGCIQETKMKLAKGQQETKRNTAYEVVTLELCGSILPAQKSITQSYEGSFHSLSHSCKN